MSYGFRAGGNTKVRRQPKMNDDIVSALRRSMAGDDPQSMPRQRGSMPRTGLPAELGHRMPVNLSNGEFEFTPEQIYAIGLHTLDAMRHGDRPGFADGNSWFSGVVDKVKGLGSQAADLYKKATPYVDTATGLYDVYKGGKDIWNGEYGKGASELGGAVPKLVNAAGNVAPEWLKKAAPSLKVIPAAVGNFDAGTEFGNGHYVQGAKDWLGSLPKTAAAAEALGLSVGEVIPVGAALAGGAAIGTAAYNKSPQVRDVSGGFFDSVGQNVMNRFGHYTEAQKTKILNDEGNRELAEQNAIAAGQGRNVYAPNLADNSSLEPDAGKTGWEKAGNHLGNFATNAVLGPSFSGNAQLDEEKQKIIAQFRQQQEESRQRRAQAAAPQVSPESY
jgi:hypothetical protein